MNFCIFLQVIGNQLTRILADPQSTEFQPPYAKEHRIFTQASTTAPQNSNITVSIYFALKASGSYAVGCH
jgi:hypothetical protein